MASLQELYDWERFWVFLVCVILQDQSHPTVANLDNFNSSFRFISVDTFDISKDLNAVRNLSKRVLI